MKLALFFELDIRNGHLIESTDYLLQLVLVTVLTCRKKARNKRKPFWIDRKFFFASGLSSKKKRKKKKKKSFHQFQWQFPLVEKKIK